MMPPEYLKFRVVRFANNYGLFYDIEYFDEVSWMGLFPRWRPITENSQLKFGPIAFSKWSDDTYGFKTLSDAEQAIEKMVAFVNNNDDREKRYYTYKFVKDEIKA